MFHNSFIYATLSNENYQVIRHLSFKSPHFENNSLYKKTKKSIIMENIILTFMSIILLLIISLFFTVQAFVLVLKERKKETYKINYVIDDFENPSETREVIIYAKFKYKNEKKLLDQAENLVKERTSFFLRARDIKVEPIFIFKDKIYNFEFKL